MKKTYRAILLSAFFSFFLVSPVFPYNQPILNPGISNFLDGFVPGPGLYVIPHFYYYNAKELKDSSGNELPGHFDLTVFTEITQIVYLSDFDVPGGKFGCEIIIPFSDIDLDGVDSESGFGDIFVGAFWQDEKKLFDVIPYHDRLLFGISLPVGRYDNMRSVNIGQNNYTLLPYYAFTAFLTPEIETSWRFQYFYHTKNTDFGPAGDDLKPGQMFQVNFAFSYALIPSLRIGASGYYAKQTSEDEVNGRKLTGSKEQILSLGPGIFYNKGNWSLFLNSQWETYAESRTEGKSLFGKILYKF